MPRTRVLLTVVATTVLLAGCVQLDTTADGGTDHDPPPGQEADTGGTTPEPQAPTGAPTVPALHPSVDDYPEALVRLTGDDLDLEIPVKVADGPDRRAHGLMEVEALPGGTGMLFMFEDERDGGFWMKNTLVPLDIAYADAEGRIHTVLAMEPCDADPCEVYAPDAPYRTALEVPQGWFDERGVEVGDELAWEPLDTTG